MARWQLGVTIASGTLGAALWIGAPAQAQPQPAQPQPAQPQPAPPTTVTPSLAVDPDQPGAMPRWTITVGAEYCGGYRIGDGIYLSLEPPLALTATPPDGSTLFAGQPAAVDWSNGVLRIAPAPGLAQSMICMAGQRALTVELLPDAGLGLPADPGDYAVDVWTGTNPTPTNLPFNVPPADRSGEQ